MPTSLRAFLMVKSQADDWDIEVFHSLEDLVRAWGSARPEANGAALHVGFERRIAKSFDALVAQFPGQLLLTPGAKGALPTAFSASQHPVGHVGEEPIFLAVDGWGYSVPEPTPPSSSQSVERSGWVRRFVEEHPGNEEALAVAGIFDEQSYLDREATLAPPLRTELGIFRSADLAGDSADDPTVLARSAPPWLRELAVEHLDLTVRIANVFRIRALKHVSDIAALTIPELMRFQNFGRTSIVQLTDILERALHAGPPASVEDLLRPATQTLLEAVRLSLDACSERERDIVVRRMGLGQPSETLEKIGESYGVTRERIRQIEAKVVDRLVQQETWDDVLAAKLQVLLADREFPLPLIGAEALDPWFAGFATFPEATHYLITNMCNAAVHLVEIDGVEYLSFLSQEAWEETVQTARRLLASGVEHQWIEDNCQQYVKLLLPDNAREYAGLLWDKASKWCHFAEDSETRTLTSYGRGVDQVVEAVLLESAAPLHYSEITPLAVGRIGREIDERRVHNAAAEVGYLFGPGTYGVLKHLSTPRAEWEAIAEEAAEIVAESAADRQWHASELIDALKSRSISLPADFDKYQLDIALKEVGQLTSLGRMVWARSAAANDVARVDVRQAVLAILRDAGGPLASAELRQRLVAVRGINQGMPFQVVDPIIKLSPQLWALNDRDLAIKRPDQPTFLDGVFSKLSARGSPLHISQCEAEIGEAVPARAVFCLAAGDARMRVTPDQFLTLSDWSAERSTDSKAARTA